MLLKEIVYEILDEVKSISDDSIFNEEHVIFLIDKYRHLFLKREYKDVKKEIPESNFQTICLTLEESPAIDGDPCTGGYYLRSVQEIPNLLTISNPKIYPSDYFQGDITYVTRERFKYVGYNNYLRTILYATIGPDNHLYFNSNNPQHRYLESVKMTGVFEDYKKAAELACEGEGKKCDILDMEFPVEAALVPGIIEAVVKEILGASYRPEDNTNNSSDDLSDLARFIANNAKSSLSKQIEGQ